MRLWARPWQWPWSSKLVHQCLLRSCKNLPDSALQHSRRHLNIIYGRTLLCRVVPLERCKSETSVSAWPIFGRAHRGLLLASSDSTVTTPNMGSRIFHPFLHFSQFSISFGPDPARGEQTYFV